MSRDLDRPVVTVKLAQVWPCATTTLCGTLTAASLLARNVAVPSGGAAIVSVTVPRAALPPVTVLGLSASVATAKMGGVPHTTTPPGLPTEVAATQNRAPAAVRQPATRPSRRPRTGLEAGRGGTALGHHERGRQRDLPRRARTRADRDCGLL